MVDANFFLPPKVAQGKVRQSHGRAVDNNIASIGTPLDHLSVKIINNHRFKDIFKFLVETQRWSESELGLILRCTRVMVCELEL